MRRFTTITLASLAFTLASAASVLAQEKAKADADTVFLTKVVPGIAASVKVIEYAAKHASDEKVRDFAERVAKQHKDSVKTASEHAKRLEITVVTNPRIARKRSTNCPSSMARPRCRLSKVVEPHS